MRAISSAVLILLLCGCEPSDDSGPVNETTKEVATSFASSRAKTAGNQTSAYANSMSGNVGPNQTEAVGFDSHKKVTSGTSVPDYETDKYCRQVAGSAGDSSFVQQRCEEEEGDARLKLAETTVPARVFTYCERSGAAAGGSYKAMNNCIKRQQGVRAVGQLK